MEKMERSLIKPVGEVNFQTSKWDFSSDLKTISVKTRILFYKKGISFTNSWFLLGRALILSKLTPFSLPFFASVYLIKRERAPLALIGLIAGAATISIKNAAFTFAVAILFLVIYRFSERWLKNELRAIPFYVALILASAD